MTKEMEDNWPAMIEMSEKPFNEKETYRPLLLSDFMGCLACGRSYYVAWWHRLVRGHWPVRAC